MLSNFEIKFACTILVLAFTSFDAKVDESVIGGPQSYSFRIQGELYHKIGSLYLAEGQRP
jgi:hypothetical protein